MVDAALFSSATGEWSTPQDFWDKLNERHQFTLDAAASHENAKCDHYFTKDGLYLKGDGFYTTDNYGEDGLTAPWGIGSRVWLNPPYGRGVGKWVEKAHKEAVRYGNRVVMLLPARTDVKWFHQYIWDREESRPYHGVTLDFVKGRLKFGGAESPAPFPSVVVTFGE